MAGQSENEPGSGALGWASIGLSITSAFLRAAQSIGRKLSPAIVEAGGHLGNAATVGAVAYEVYREESLAHKGERAAADVGSAGLNIALAGAAATTGETAALTGVAGATGATVITAAAPVALSVATAATTAKVADMAIENRRAYEALDRDIAQNAAPQKIRQRAEGEKPSILDYKHLCGMREVTAHLRDEALQVSVPIERFPESRRIKNLGAIDMTASQNLREYERALNAEIARQRAIMAANDSYLPRWLRGGDSVVKYNDAHDELENLRGAQEELALFRQDVQRWNQRHISSDVAQASRQETEPAGKRQQVASGFNVAGGAAEKPERHQEPGDVAAARQLSSSPSVASLVSPLGSRRTLTPG
jgi:hypothetical protein